MNPSVLKSLYDDQLEAENRAQALSAKRSLRLRQAALDHQARLSAHFDSLRPYLDDVQRAFPELIVQRIAEPHTHLTKGYALSVQSLPHLPLSITRADCIVVQIPGRGREIIVQRFEDESTFTPDAIGKLIAQMVLRTLKGW